MGTLPLALAKSSILEELAGPPSPLLLYLDVFGVLVTPGATIGGAYNICS